MTPNHKSDLDWARSLGVGSTLRQLWYGADWRCHVVLLLSPLLLTTWKYFCSYQALNENLPEQILFVEKNSQIVELIHFALSFLLLGCIPCLVIRMLFRERLRDYGIQFGDIGYGLKILGGLLPIFIAAAYLAAPDPQLMTEYPLDKLADRSTGRFLLHATGYFLFYVGWEIYFRGFMQFGLQARFGVWQAILVQTLASCLLHIGKPTGEIFGSIAGGILWGIIAYRGQSIWPCLGMHATLGILLDVFICANR